MKAQIPWLRVFVEGVVIVGSILLAFGIQAWWEGVQEREEEIRLLSAVLDEMRTNLAEVERNSAYHRAMDTTEREILMLAGKDPSTLSQDVVDTLIADLTWFSAGSWALGAVESLTLGANLSIIQNEELRQTLASWTGVISRVRLVEDQSYDFFSTVLLPLMRREGWLPQVSDLQTAVPGTMEPYNVGRVNISQVRWDHRELIVSREFQNTVLQKLWIQTDILRDFDRFSTQLSAVIARIESELQEAGP